MLAHAASRMGEVAMKMPLKGNNKSQVKLNSDSCSYLHTSWKLRLKTEEQAREKYDVQIGKFNLRLTDASDVLKDFL